MSCDRRFAVVRKGDFSSAAQEKTPVNTACRCMEVTARGSTRNPCVVSVDRRSIQLSYGRREDILVVASSGPLIPDHRLDTGYTTSAVRHLRLLVSRYLRATRLIAI